MKVINLAGKTFSRLTVLSRVGSSKFGQALWSCVCSCGAVRNVEGYRLRSGHTKSCGCIKKESANNRINFHGLIMSVEYHSWAGMKARCSNKNNPNWGNYGGRGITVCERWWDFKLFYKDMGNMPTQYHSIDRIDNDGNYELGNCRWATALQQSRNKRISSKNTSGATGVCKDGNGWRAYIGMPGERINLYHGPNFRDAVVARKSGEEQYWL